MSEDTTQVGYSDNSPQEEQDSDLISEIRGLFEYKWQIAGIVVICVLLTAVWVFSQEKIYRAASTLQIEPRQNSVISNTEVYDTGAGSEGYFATQHAILRSRDLAKKAVKKIDWSKHPEFLPNPGKVEKSWVDKLLAYLPLVDADAQDVVDEDAVESVNRFPDSPVKADATGETLDVNDDKLEAALVGLVMGGTQIVPVYGTQLVNVQFLSSSRKLAKEASNALSEAYIESGFEAKLEATARASEWLNSRLGDLRSSLEQSEGKLQQFRESNDLVNIGGGRGVLADELTDNTQRLRDAQRKKTSLQNTYEKIQQANGDAELLEEIPVLLNNELVSATKRSFIASEEELSQLQSRYGPKHPRIISAAAKLQEAEAAFHRQLLNAADGIRADYEIAAQNVRSLSQVVDSTRNAIRRLDRKEYQLEVLQRDSQTNSELYNTVLSRFKEADIAGDFQTVKARVVDQAELPKLPFLPKKKRALALAAFFGLFLGTGIALVRRRLDDSVKTGDELEKIMGTAVFASVPRIARASDGPVPSIVSAKPNSIYAEAVRTVRTGIVLSDLTRKKKRLLVTSALQLEGKSSLCTNLAFSFGQMEKVLLIDCDLRRPTLVRYLESKTANPPGLVEVLSGEAKLADVLQKVGEGVHFLPAGKTPPNPVELITSEPFRALLDRAGEHYDRIILDSAPCVPVSDTLLLGKYVDGVVFVVQHDSTGRRIVQNTVKRLRQAQIPVIGAILNKVDLRKANQYGDSYAYYGNRYYG